jgi:hypothetical protein
VRRGRTRKRARETYLSLVERLRGDVLISVLVLVRVVGKLGEVAIVLVLGVLRALEVLEFLEKGREGGKVRWERGEGETEGGFAEVWRSSSQWRDVIRCETKSVFATNG